MKESSKTMQRGTKQSLVKRRHEPWNLCLGEVASTWVIWSIKSNLEEQSNVKHQIFVESFGWVT